MKLVVYLGTKRVAEVSLDEKPAPADRITVAVVGGKRPLFVTGRLEQA